MNIVDLARTIFQPFGAASAPSPTPTPTATPPAFGPGTDILSAAQAWWQGTPAAQALSSTGQLWHLQAPEDGETLPYVTFFLVSETPETWTTSYPFMRSSLQFNAHAATDAQARSMGAALRKLFRGAPLVVNSSDIDHCLPDGSAIQLGEGLAPGGRDCWVATETFDIAWTP